jgi:hypothetical protein
MSAVATTSQNAFTPAAFSACLLEAVAVDRRRDERDRAQHSLLLRPYVGTSVDAPTFEQQMASHCRRTTDVAEVARDILTLWRVCNSPR